MDIDDADVPEIGKEDLLGLSLASLSLTEDHGDLKVRAFNPEYQSIRYSCNL